MKNREHDDDELELEDDELEDELEVEDDLQVRGAMGFLAGLVLGGILGAGAALLLAPQRGEVTRRRLRRRMSDIRTDAADQLGDLKDDARRELKRQRKRLKRRLPGS